MNIKSFFKPTKLKTLIFIILVLLAFTIGLDKEPVGVGEPTLPNLQYVAPECIDYLNLLPGFWPFPIEACNVNGFPILVIPSVIADYADYFDYLSNTNFFQNTAILLFSILFVLLSTIYWYLLSCLLACLIIFIYQKIKNANQKS